MAKQKVKAHLVVSDGYGVAIAASQWIGELQEHCDTWNADEGGANWRNERRSRAIVTVEFEIDDSIFEPPPIPVYEGTAAATQGDK